MGGNVKPIVMLLYRLDASDKTKDRPYYIYTMMKVIGLIAMGAQFLGRFGFVYSIFGVATKRISGLSGFVLGTLSASLFAYVNRIISFEVTLGFLKGQEIGMTTLGALLETFYRPILAEAQKSRTPVLDLANMFDPYNSNLYTSQIEPSQAGGSLIAQGLSHIIKHSKPEEEPSLIYFTTPTGAMTSKVNEPLKWKVIYPKSNF